MEDKNKEKIILTGQDIEKALVRLSHQILEKNPNPNEIALVGIQTRGVPLAKRIKNIVEDISKTSLPLGELDITLYRDDLTTIGPNPVVKKTVIGFDIYEKIIILVDDVLFSGRTVRAALDQIMDFGRPEKIQLLTLIDRGHRELPFRADFVGKNIPTAKEQIVEVKLKEIDSEDKAVLRGKR
ncbi:MAG: bifunctional pyr operon transcriptional regulator/uracil phosphoribosyltransferase PyrR [Candidatus Omnitrophica bacterium]|nr:bifunctional pyr operon transcriptional regulator/uracil phosphoribosyltransferase PyrR [Candidatus Omnitrophota bacterium]MCF7893698.1 bifunctional pyr operon transcriptional regulator/uracil phosphoribosyltransferase PyrR [Candidatus Omnitrophota bacterium]